MGGTRGQSDRERNCARAVSSLTDERLRYLVLYFSLPPVHQMQRILQTYRPKPKDIHVYSGRHLRNNESSKEQVPVLPVQEMHRTRDGVAG